MRLAGHTMGTPDLTVEQALGLFASIGYEGAEVVWQDAYRSGVPEDCPERDLVRLRAIADGLGVPIVCLTPYMTAISSLEDEERERDIERFRACINAAERLGATMIRTYAGTYRPGDGDREEKRHRTVDALRDLGTFAAAHGVVLAVENHFSTLTVTARETVDLVAEVDSTGVGILYDQANLTFTHAEPWPEAVAIQRDWIRHVQVKDLEFTDPQAPFVASAVASVSAAERTVRSRVVGEGVLDWPGILRNLQDIGYDGYLSVEYEYRWHPQDLPVPEVGFRRSLETLRPILASLGRAAS